MKKTYKEQCADIWAKEEKKAKELGFSTVADYRKAQANENKKKTYLAKIARYEKAIADMKAWIEANE